MYNHVDFPYFVVMISERRSRQITGRRGKARSGLLGHGNAEKRWISDALRRTARRSHLFMPGILYRYNQNRIIQTDPINKHFHWRADS